MRTKSSHKGHTVAKFMYVESRGIVCGKRNLFVRPADLTSFLRQGEGRNYLALVMCDGNERVTGLESHVDKIAYDGFTSYPGCIV